MFFRKKNQFLYLGPTDFLLISRCFVGCYYECDLFPLYFLFGSEVMVNMIEPLKLALRELPFCRTSWNLDKAKC